MRQRFLFAVLLLSVAPYAEVALGYGWVMRPWKEFLSHAKTIVAGKLVDLHLEIAGDNVIETGAIRVERVLLGDLGGAKRVAVYTETPTEGGCSLMTIREYFGQDVIWILDVDAVAPAKIDHQQQVVGRTPWSGEIWPDEEREKLEGIRSEICTPEAGLRVDGRYEALCAFVSGPPAPARLQP